MRASHSLLLFFALAIALRWGSFFISVVDHDESTYIVIADELLRGESYLRDVVDTKPIGIFWIYAALISLTGGSIFALRLAAALVLALGAWGLYWAGRRATGSARVGLAAGIIYCWCCSIFTYYGLSPNTEIFFNLFTIAAVALAVAPRLGEGADPPFWHWPVAGLLLGLAFIIKPFAAAEALAIGLFLVWFYGRRGAWGRLFAGGTALVGTFALPLAFVYFYFQRQGLLAEFYFYTFEVSAAYPVDLPWYLRLKYMGDYLLRYAPFVLLGAGAQVQSWRMRSKESIRWGTYLLLQFLLVTAVVLLTGKRFGHYQIQLHPVLALLAATWWTSGLTVYPWLRSASVKRWGPALLVVASLSMGLMYYGYYGRKEDQSAQIAAYLEPRLQAGETFFPINGWQITYHLLDRPSPTRFVHSSLLFLDHHVEAFQIDERAEAERLIANPNLKYLIGRNEDPEADTPLKARLLEVFLPYDTIGPKLLVWKRE